MTNRQRKSKTKSGACGVHIINPKKSPFGAVERPILKVLLGKVC